ncbi:MAG: YlxR family protein [Clostridiales bacterium]|nr:YlxR family protein [Clostridiales bacterium]
MKVRKVPLRKCIGCNENKPKKELIRIVRNKSGEIKVDITGKAHGRGAYICKIKDCFTKIKENKTLNHTFKSDVPEEVYDDLIKEIDDYE